jgi:predicted amidophosphoribosyltransferase
MAPKRKNEICLVCGKASQRLICALCARKLNDEARHEHNRHEQEEMREKIHHG